jgi:hypothetical protein
MRTYIVKCEWSNGEVEHVLYHDVKGTLSSWVTPIPDALDIAKREVIKDNPGLTRKVKMTFVIQPLHHSIHAEEKWNEPPWLE